MTEGYSVWVAKKLEKAIVRCRLPENVANEVRLLYKQFVEEGFFAYSTVRIEKTWGSAARKTLKRFIDGLIIRGHITVSRGAVPGMSCKRYAFCISGYIPRKGGLPRDIEGRRMYPRSFYKQHTKYVLPDAWLKLRMTTWVDVCKELGWACKFDYSGLTHWGRCVKRGVEQAILPVLSEGQIFKMVGGNWWKHQWWTSILNRQPSTHAFISKGRLYHHLTVLPRKIRDLLTFQYNGGIEKSATVDMSATYFTLIIPRIKDKRERKKLIDILRRGDIYTLIAPDGMSRDDAKVEFQKQCLFWKENDKRHRPMWAKMQEMFPSFCGYVLSMRRKLGVSGFAIALMNTEGQIFINRVLKVLDEKEIPVVHMHDGLVVPSSVKGFVKTLIENVSRDFLGFTPKVKASNGAA